LVMLRQVKKMGPLTQLVDMIPGFRQRMKGAADVDDRSLVRLEAILSSMTARERQRPQIIDGSRRRRIARGSGTTVQEVNRLLQQHDAMRKLMKQMKGPKGKGRRGRGGAPPPGWPPGLPSLPE